MIDTPGFTYEVTSDTGKVRLLLNDVDADTAVFNDLEIQAFLDLEGGSVKRAAAQAIDTNATNEVLASKVLRTQDVQTDGAKVADAMRKHAESLRAQADREDDLSDDGAVFEIIPGSTCRPELTGIPTFPYC
jgi:hypothetical protein